MSNVYTIQTMGILFCPIKLPSTTSAAENNRRAQSILSITDTCYRSMSAGWDLRSRILFKSIIY